jgi:gamma-glutamyl-gamma-aminobutyrate hydrolase PuuD
MRLVAVSQNQHYRATHGHTIDSLDNHWHAFLCECSIVPLLIPNHFPAAKSLIDRYSIDGILLSGGEDSKTRHEVEDYLLQLSTKYRIPTLGICHGMQSIQQKFGIEIYPVDNHIHHSQVISIHQKRISVNSFHRYGTDKTSPELIVWARAADGIVKAIKHRELPIFGLMWHPERTNPFAPGDLALCKRLFYGEHVCSAQLY